MTIGPFEIKTNYYSSQVDDGWDVLDEEEILEAQEKIPSRESSLVIKGDTEVASAPIIVKKCIADLLDVNLDIGADKDLEIEVSSAPIIVKKDLEIVASNGNNIAISIIARNGISDQTEDPQENQKPAPLVLSTKTSRCPCCVIL